MGNENILFDPILFFSSNNLEELVEKAKNYKNLVIKEIFISYQQLFKCKVYAKKK